MTFDQRERVTLCSVADCDQKTGRHIDDLGLGDYMLKRVPICENHEAVWRDPDAEPLQFDPLKFRWYGTVLEGRTRFQALEQRFTETVDAIRDETETRLKPVVARLDNIPITPEEVEKGLRRNV